MINFPTTLDSLPNPTSTDLLENATTELDHDQQHSNANDAIEALEAKVGINSSAVNTSHDFKLSGVLTGDKAVSKTGTETLTNKTLSAPQFNFGSDTNGDIIIRNASGVTSRLAAGSASTILSINSGTGLPEWIPNPSASDASTTVKGIVEQATTAEINAGTATGGTGAKLFVSPDQLATSAPIFSGANLTNLPNPVSYTNGTTTKNAADASTTQNIAHGLGKVPKKVKILARTVNTQANTIYNGTTQSSNSTYITGIGSSINDSTFSLNTDTSASYQRGVVTFDATNIIITWTKTNNATGTYNLLWEAQG